jgi:hypothetical protein
MVMTQARTTFWATPQRTAEARRATPAPMMQPVIVWVVETGIPNHDAVNSITEPPAEALKPWCWDSLVIREPIVLMIRQPPLSVPRPIAI